MPVRLEEHRANVHSQFGEDGMIRAALAVLPGVHKCCVEFGAWDGRFGSNTYRLMNEEGWAGVLIEGNSARYRDLRRTYAGNPRAVCVNAMVESGGPNSLDRILEHTGAVPYDFDLVSIDVDGLEYHLWRTCTTYHPKMVVIEFNPSIPIDIEFVQPADATIHQGSSLAALTRLGKEKGYELVATSDVNAFFVARDLYPAFAIEDNSLAAIRTDRSYETRVFQLLDGTLCWEGCTELLWHGVKFNQPQVVPKSLRWLPGTEPTFARRAARRLYVELARRVTRSPGANRTPGETADERWDVARTVGGPHVVHDAGGHWLPAGDEEQALVAGAATMGLDETDGAGLGGESPSDSDAARTERHEDDRL